MPVDPIDRYSVLLWLPESFNSMLINLIAQEENESHRGALSRCLSGLRSQTLSANALASKDILSEVSLSEERFF